MILQDLRFSFRMLIKRPGFSLVALFTLALGIGANTAIFSAVNSVLFNSLPYPQAEQLVVINSSNPEKGFTRFGASYQDFEDWEKQNTTFEGIAAYNGASGNLTGSDEPQRVRYAQVTANLFSVLGVSPVTGRSFAADEDQPGKDRVVILSYAFWKERFGGDAETVGKSLMLSGHPVTVIGVMPQGFEFPDAETQMWRPIGLTPDQSGSRGSHWLSTIGRLKAGVLVEQAQAESSAIAARLAEQYPDTNKGWGILVEPYQDILVGDVRQPLLLLWGAVGLVMLIACANVANLMLARSTERKREIALRAALGAARARLVRQLLTESVLLAMTGCALGLLLALGGLEVLKSMIADLVPRAQEIKIDLQALAYSIGISLAAGIIFGVLPAFKSSSAALSESLKESARSSSGTSARRLRGVLVAGEIALAVVVLIGAGLLIRSFITLLEVNPGFDPRNVLTMRIAPPFTTSPEGKDEETFVKELFAEKDRAKEFYRQLLERLEALPGVASVGAVNRLPLTGNWWVESFAVEGRLPDNSQDKHTANGRAVMPGYFQTMGVPLLQGRVLAETDSEHSHPVIVINQTAARRYWADENPVGQRITLDDIGSGNPHWYTIAGIVGDERHNQLEMEPRPILYFTFAQARSGFGSDWGMDIVLKAESNPLSLIGAVRAQVLDLNRNLPVFNINSMEQIVARNVAERRSVMLLLSVLAAGALLLAAAGIYGVIAYTVSQRTQEIGIRMALGAGSRNIFRLVIGQGAGLALIGLILGLTTAAAMTRYLESMLYRVGATDAMTFAAVAALLMLVALVACYIPARRAAKVDPMIALRCE